MPKRKGADSSEDGSFSADNSDQHESDAAASSQEEVSLKLRKDKDKQGAPAKKKAKPVPDASNSSSKKQSSTTDGNVKVNNEGDKYIDLGKKKRAVVRAFKGVTLIDIREYYGAEGEEKPGKKGISLTPDQWKALKESTEEIDSLLSELQKNK